VKQEQPDMGKQHVIQYQADHFPDLRKMVRTNAGDHFREVTKMIKNKEFFHFPGLRKMVGTNMGDHFREVTKMITVGM